MKIEAKHIQAALIRRYDSPNNTWMCNVFFCGGEADFLYYTKAGYCHEIEIKVSIPDWNADLKKDKWKHPDRKKIRFLSYAVPESLWNKAPQWVKDREDIGILTFRPIETPNGTYLACVEQRKARKIEGSIKLTAADQLYIIKKTWSRYADQMRQQASRRYYIEQEQSVSSDEESVVCVDKPILQTK